MILALQYELSVGSIYWYDIHACLLAGISVAVSTDCYGTQA